MTANPTPRLALTMCVRDEADTVLDQLHYHHHLGATGAYIYLDHCADATAQLLADLEWVTAIDYSRQLDCPGLPAHQTLCAKNAFERARADGFDWLMHIDSDEYAWPNQCLQGPIQPGALLKMLQGAKPETELIHLTPVEVMPEKGLGVRRFWEQCYFQYRGQLVRRNMLDPVSGQIRRLDKWAGHTIGKSIVRTNCEAEPDWSHSWKRRGTMQSLDSLVSEILGFHYHFVFMGPRLWREKYRKLAWEPDNWITGGMVPFPKQAWKDAAQAFSVEQAEEYYERWIALKPAELSLMAKRGEVTYDTRLRDTLRALMLRQ